MWVLVFINLMFNPDYGDDEPVIEAWYEFETMEDCFIGRQILINSLGGLNGYPPSGTQAVCIQKEIYSMDSLEK